ncbi:MAG: hypothetical protein IJW63_00015 [Lachnospiraceae bacterium]|nr:hypothetical protein [Lachnospiraceae bacterium]
MKEFAENLEGLIKKIILGLILYKNNHDNQRMVDTKNYMSKRDYFDRLEEWLKKQGIYNVSFDKVLGVFINDEITRKEEKAYSGISIKYDDNHIVLFVNAENPEVTTAILTHEIIHVELEEVFDEIEKKQQCSISEEDKEEIVTFFEHLVLETVFDIFQNDMCEEQYDTFKNRFISLMNDNCEETILRWLSRKKEKI